MSKLNFIGTQTCLIFIIALFLKPLAAYAVNTSFTLYCNQNTTALSNEFVKNDWQQTPMPWYASWAHDEVDGYLFIGGIRTTQNHYPHDPNPHLQFMNSTILHDEERGEVVICRYQINNSEMMDTDNGLEMRYFTYLPLYACVVSSQDAVTCSD